MLAYSEQGQVLVLAMDVHQVSAQRAQQPERYDSPIHTAGVAAIQVDFPGEDYLLFANVKIVLVQNNIDSLSDVAAEQEDAFHPGLAGTGTHHADIGAPPKQKAQGINDDRLAGPSLAGEDAEPGSQFNVELFDGGEVGNTEESERGYVRNNITLSSAFRSNQNDGPLGAHANAASRNSEEQRLALTPVALPDGVDDILAADSYSGQN